MLKLKIKYCHRSMTYKENPAIHSVAVHIIDFSLSCSINMRQINIIISYPYIFTVHQLIKISSINQKLYMCMCVCLCVSMYVYLSVCQRVCLCVSVSAICLSIHPPARPPTHLFVSPFIHLFVHPSTRPLIRPSIYFHRMMLV